MSHSMNVDPATWEERGRIIHETRAKVEANLEGIQRLEKRIDEFEQVTEKRFGTILDRLDRLIEKADSRIEKAELRIKALESDTDIKNGSIRMLVYFIGPAGTIGALIAAIAALWKASKGS